MSIKDFQILSKLGEGAYSSVFKVKRLIDDEIYAIKKVKLTTLSQKQKANALNEVRIIASFRHPNIVGYKQAFIDESSNSLCIVMEYLDGGDLYQKIVQQQNKGIFFEESFIWNVFLQVVKGLKALHQSSILHRDLKSANVFLTKNGVAKIGDMNVSKVTNKGFGETQTGTPYYASPQVWKDQVYNSKSDIWSLGCVLYETITLKPPFRAEDMQGLYKKVTRGSYPRIPSTYSVELSHLIKNLLKLKPEQRPSCEEILSYGYAKKKMRDSSIPQFDQPQTRLLKTIKIGKNIGNLTDRMPKPNYSPMKNNRQPSNKNRSSISTVIEEENNNNSASLPFLRKIDIGLKQKKDESIDKKNRVLLPPIRRSLNKAQQRYLNYDIELPSIKKGKQPINKRIYF